jgi:16S rRNA (uracil1498-N3)-methyltransferase
MNLVLLEPGELDGSLAVVRGKRAHHIATVHRAVPGKTLKAGLVGGRVGRAVVVSCDRDRVELDVELTADPPAPLPCTLVLALPRPIVLRRILAAVATFGIKRVLLVGGARVEKSYWMSPVLGDEAIREALVLGLEQGCDTVLPVVEQKQRFRPFAEDELAEIADGTLALVAHPGNGAPCPRVEAGAVTLAVGPEGGYVDFELELLAEAGFQEVTLGTRPLRTEHAIPALLGRLF